MDWQTAARDRNLLDNTRATAREWVGLGVIALPCLLFSMDLNVLHLAVPQIAAALRPSASQLLWIIDIYGFFLAGCLIAMGTLGDYIGRRRLLMIGAAAFGVVSAVAAFATSAEMLILCRAALGVAGATLAPSTLSLIRSMFRDTRERTIAIGVWGSCFAAGTVLGPVIGGVLLEHFHWGSVFLLAVPLMGLLLVAAPLLLAESRGRSDRPPDVVSAALITTAVLAIVYAVKRTAEQRPVAGTLLVAAAGLIIGVIFLRRQRRLPDPMVDLQLFRDPSLSAALGANVVGVFGAAGSFLFAAQYLQLVCGMTPFEAGMWMAPLGLVHVAGAILTPALAHRFDIRKVLPAAFIVAALGHLTLALVTPTGAPWIAIGGATLFLAGVVPILTITTNLVLSKAPARRAGLIAGVSEASAELGAALGIAVLGSVAIAVYRAHMSASALPGIPLDAAVASRDAAATAIAIASHLHTGAGKVLLDTARQAFTTSMQAAAVTSTLLSIAGAALCAAFIRSDRSGKGN